MKSLTEHIKRVSLAVIALSSVGLYSNVFAATGETDAGVEIKNTASVAYTVGTVTQTAIPSNEAKFLVDKRVDLTVAKGSGVSTVPGATLVGLPFTVTNTGNASDSFTLAAANGTGDEFDPTSYALYLDVNKNGSYDAGTDTAITGVVTIARDLTSDPTINTIHVLIVSTIPGTVLNTNTSNMTLTATTTSVKTTGAETDTVVDVVFADAGNNGTEVDTNTYTIVTATLAVVKSAAVISDPVNGTTFPKAIPGATVRYTIVVTNSGGQSATAVTLTDSIPTNTTYKAGTMTLGGAARTDSSSDSDGASATASGISVDAGTVATSGTATVTFDVTVN